MNCPNCNTEIIAKNINIKADIAQCHECNTIFKISSTLNETTTFDFELNNPPKGAWIESEVDEIVIGASTRSPIAFFMVPFMLVWTGGSIGGIYGKQLVSGKFDLMMSLFGIPFILGALLFWSITFMTLWGKIEITLDSKGGKVFTGIGLFGRTKKFSWAEVSVVREKKSYFNSAGNNGNAIYLEGKRRISFGTILRSSRRYYLYNALKIIMHKIKSKEAFS